jgi:hypothetical protein
MAMRGGVSVKILGARESAANIAQMSKAARKRFFEVMVKLAEEVLQHSKDTYVPFLSGALEASGRTEAFPGRYPSVRIIFGNSDVPYALMQHENMDFQHPRGGSAKYLEYAVKDYEERFRQDLLEETRKELYKYDMRAKVF